jgi:RND family efflux transporter MFP subunit
MMARESTQTARQKKPGRGPLLVFFAVLGLVVAAAVVGGVVPRLSRQRGLAAAAENVTERKPVVLVSPAHYGAQQDTVDLPADLVAMIESPIFARADGYLKARLVDYGWHVKSGQPMAELDTPELDQQISQARATLEQSQAALKELQSDIDLAKANLDLARVTQERWLKLQQQGVVSKQDLDTRQADLAVKEATLRKAESALATAQNTIHANDASVKRLVELKSFSRITAPFDGVITARDVDVGTLINAGTKELFKVAQIDPIRIFVNVPQAYVASIAQGQTAEVRVQERPGQVWHAQVTGISPTLDPNSRAMLAILRAANPEGTLYPGMYAQVRLHVAQGKAALRIPGDALVLGKTGARVAVAGDDHLVHFRPVTIGQDLGAEVEVTSGLHEGELVVSNPTDAVTEGAAVEIRKR